MLRNYFLNKYIISILVLSIHILSLSAYSNESAKKMIENDLSNHGSSYKIGTFKVLNYIGIENRSYTFNLLYKKKFCTQENQDCKWLTCYSKVSLDTDAIVDFEPATDESSCL